MDYLREVSGSEQKPKAELKALCEKRKRELRSGIAACGGEQVNVTGESAHSATGTCCVLCGKSTFRCFQVGQTYQAKYW